MRESLLDDVLAEVKRVRGVDLSGYRSETLDARLAERMEELGYDDPGLYLERLRGCPEECDHLVDAMAVNFSLFFRNPIVFEIVAQRILPEIIRRRRGLARREIRVWSAGCASGEEPYSLAILLHEALAEDQDEWVPYIFATDIDRATLAQAEKGLYPRERLENVKLGMVDKHFIRRADQYEIQPYLRRDVYLSVDDLASLRTSAPSESIFGAFDIVLCRNVLIYLSPALQSSVMAKLCSALAPGGYLVLGDAETLNRDLESSLSTVDAMNRIYQRRT